MRKTERYRNMPGHETPETGYTGKHTWLAFPVIILSCFFTAVLLLGMLGNTAMDVTVTSANTNVMDVYDRYLTNQLSNVLDGIMPIEQTYWLSDTDMVAPEPDPNGYGQANDPAELQWLLENAAKLLDGQKTLFTPETAIKEGSTIHYYLDDTIFAVIWKQAIEDCVYTFSEVKIAHASQFRRFLSDGKYGSSVLRTTTEMSESVNAVVASSGDYYGYRSIGIVVNNGQVFRDRGHFLDTCYIDEDGDLLFTYAGEIIDMETAQTFVDDHNVRFSLSFGPVMILDGEYCVPDTYNSGEINNPYARAALCQMDKLHYVVVTANSEDPHYCVPTVGQFARNLQKMGIPKAYALDGGQTAAIAMNDQLINTVSYGSQREISDIIYFATAIPNSKDGRVTG